MKHISTLTSATLKQTAAHGGFLPVRMQDLLHRGKPEVRARKVITLKRNMQGAPAGAPCSCISEENK
jgi:hypothetical protein